MPLESFFIFFIHSVILLAKFIIPIPKNYIFLEYFPLHVIDLWFYSTLNVYEPHYLYHHIHIFFKSNRQAFNYAALKKAVNKVIFCVNAIKKKHISRFQFQYQITAHVSLVFVQNMGLTYK
jgi:hypothetical protein